VRPAKQFWMTVTGYSPDARSCGDSADGLTATLHSVNTNNMRLVAADTSILPYGSLVTVPGYAEGEVVPVLDCGGAIKGRRLDLLYPTHEAARQWGRQRILVTIWEYADGKPSDNPRKVR
jgi:3D (Asp-Asp-Asp) domain-containing protein